MFPTDGRDRTRLHLVDSLVVYQAFGVRSLGGGSLALRLCSCTRQVMLTETLRKPAFTVLGEFEHVLAALGCRYVSAGWNVMVVIIGARVLTQ